MNHKSKLLIEEIPISPGTIKRTISEYDLKQELVQGPRIEIYDLKELCTSDTDSNFATTKLRPSASLRDSSSSVMLAGQKRTLASPQLQNSSKKQRNQLTTIHHVNSKKRNK